MVIHPNRSIQRVLLIKFKISKRYNKTWAKRNYLNWKVLIDHWQDITVMRMSLRFHYLQKLRNKRLLKKRLTKVMQKEMSNLLRECNKYMNTHFRIYYIWTRMFSINICKKLNRFLVLYHKIRRGKSKCKANFWRSVLGHRVWIHSKTKKFSKI